MSHPDLFSHFVLERPSKEDGNEEEMHLALKKLLRHSALSNHRLKSVDMNLFCFDRDLESICDSWESTEFSMIFDLLASPNSTHKRLHLRLPWLTNHWSYPKPSEVIMTIIQHLHPFEQLIEAAVPFSFLSQSTKRYFSVSTTYESESDEDT